LFALLLVYPPLVFHALDVPLGVFSVVFVAPPHLPLAVPLHVVAPPVRPDLLVLTPPQDPQFRTVLHRYHNHPLRIHSLRSPYKLNF
jgi:hypothetical protein